MSRSAAESVALRIMQPHDIEPVAALTARVFAEQDTRAQATVTIAQAYRSCPMMPLNHCLLAERDGAIIGKWQALDLQVRVGTTSVRAAGLHAVLVDPRVDGEGLAWSMVPEGLVRLAGLGHDLAVGFASRGAAYSALGGRPVAAEYDWALDTWQVPRRDSALPFHEATAHDIPAVLEWCNQAQQTRSGSLVRGPGAWEWLPRRPETLWVAPHGYLGVRWSESPTGHKELEVREAGGDPSFYRDALSYLSATARERGVRHVRGHLPGDHPLVLASIPFGAQVHTHYPRRSGMMAAVLRPQTLLPKLRQELTRRLARSRVGARPLALTFRTFFGVSAAR